MSKQVCISDGHGNAIEYLDEGLVAGPITVKNGKFVITAGSAQAFTIANPNPGVESQNGDDGKTVKIISQTAFAHTITSTTKFNTGAAGAGVITFAGVAGDSVTLTAFGGVWMVSPAASNATIA